MVKQSHDELFTYGPFTLTIRLDAQTFSSGAGVGKITVGMYRRSIIHLVSWLVKSAK